jgi:hypothetical protein
MSIPSHLSTVWMKLATSTCMVWRKCYMMYGQSLATGMHVCETTYCALYLNKPFSCFNSSLHVTRHDAGQLIGCRAWCGFGTWVAMNPGVRRCRANTWCVGAGASFSNYPSFSRAFNTKGHASNRQKM